MDANENCTRTLHSFMEATRREAAVLASDMIGAQAYVGQFGPNFGSNSLTRADRKQFRDAIEEDVLPFLVLDPRPGLHIVEVNPAYAAATMTNRRRIAGEKLFDIFPDNPDIPDADGVSNLYESLQKTVTSGRPHAMAVQRYDVRDAGGHFVERYWRPVNTPLFDDAGNLIYLLHRVVDVTADELRARSE